MIREWASDPKPSVSASEVFAVFEFVHGATVGALGFAVQCHVQVHLGVVVPEFHARQGAGAKNATLVVKVFGEKFDSGFAHGSFG